MQNSTLVPKRIATTTQKLRTTLTIQDVRTLLGAPPAASISLRLRVENRTMTLDWEMDDKITLSAEWIEAESEVGKGESEG